ncbi:MAG: hypothetical protein ACKPKO_54510, partial [Candidatus Fonsibacter sp.]
MKAKQYVRYLLDELDCVKQDGTNFNLSMSFYRLESLTEPLVTDIIVNRFSQEYVDQICESITIKNEYDSYINTYKRIIGTFVNKDFVSWPQEFAKEYLNEVVNQLFYGREDGPLGLRVPADYFEDSFKDKVIHYKCIT